MEERRYATDILMAHGITAAEGRIVSRKAQFEDLRATATISGIEKMIVKYEQELAEFKHRLEEMEMAEVARNE